MKKFPEKDEIIGPFTGRIGVAWRSDGLLSSLERIASIVNENCAEVLTSGRSRNIKVELPCNNRALTVVVKEFGMPGRLKNAMDRKHRGSKARRSWLAAVRLVEHGVGSPEPVALLERWDENRLVESYYISVFQENPRSFKDELVNLYRNESECEKFIELMQAVAEGVRAMHDAGFLHNDLGNQNILLRRTGECSWENVQFVDLNRGYILPTLTLKQRARDVSRISLPSDLLRVFKEMYWDDVPPAGFQEWEERYRKRFARHSHTRRVRHPIREARIRRQADRESEYPPKKDMWIWDERSGQAQVVMRSKDRRRYYSFSRIWGTVASTVKAAFPVWKIYKQLLISAYQAPVSMEGRIGIAIEPFSGRIDRQLELLSELGSIPVFVRFYHHRDAAGRAEAVDAVTRLHKAGHPVDIALVQDRAAVKDPAAWARFAEDVLEQVDGMVRRVEIGHAINRVKWGVWESDEYRMLCEGVSGLREKFSEIEFSGPAVIDFEYPYVFASLDNLPSGFRFSALSHHLYVDRRGAPENFQGRFSSLEKFALGRAIACWSRKCDDRFTVSEVNWPIRGTGVYSPVGSPYVSPGARGDGPGVSEDDYADYMIRYYLIALCSGLVDRVYWWRLVAYGYGLVDDSDAENWRVRPAFEMLATLLKRIGNATFELRQELNGSGAVAFIFSREDGSRFSVAYTVEADGCELDFPGRIVRVEDAFGEELEVMNHWLHLGGRPVYVELEGDG